MLPFYSSFNSLSLDFAYVSGVHFKTYFFPIFILILIFEEPILFIHYFLQKNYKYIYLTPLLVVMLCMLHCILGYIWLLPKFFWHCQQHMNCCWLPLCCAVPYSLQKFDRVFCYRTEFGRHSSSCHRHLHTFACHCPKSNIWIKVPLPAQMWTLFPFSRAIFHHFVSPMWDSLSVYSCKISNLVPFSLWSINILGTKRRNLSSTRPYQIARRPGGRCKS